MRKMAFNTSSNNSNFLYTPSPFNDDKFEVVDKPHFLWTEADKRQFGFNFKVKNLSIMYLGEKSIYLCT